MTTDKRDERSPCLVLASTLEIVFMMRRKSVKLAPWVDSEEQPDEFFGRMACTVAAEAVTRADSRITSEEFASILTPLVISWYAFHGYTEGDGVNALEVELCCNYAATEYFEHLKRNPRPEPEED